MERRYAGPGTSESRRSRLRLRAVRGAAAVLELRGEFDLATVPDIDRFLRRRLGPLYRRRDLVLDLSGATLVDSSFIAFVVGLVTDLRATGRELLLVRPMGQVRRVVALVGLPNLVPVFETVEEALRSLAAGPLPLIPPPFDPTGVAAARTH
jgi:anti-anti-sigma factor